MESRFRCLPSVDSLLSEARIRQLGEVYPHDVVVDLIRKDLDRNRALIAGGGECPSSGEIVESICARLRELVSPGPRPVINATGVILHTNLGRAPLSKAAIEAMAKAGKGYCDLEFDLQTGQRGSRDVHVEALICQITGAEAALVVNNNASAVLLGLSALARRKEVIVSRGQSIEIGGGFRIPEVLRQSGAKLVEVGTTNCTYARDFEEAIGPRTAALLSVHSSNFRIVGFAADVALRELVELAGRYDLLVLDDLGSGCLLDTTAFGLGPEPRVQDSISQGASLAFFSGDKLLGGPQAGIIAGRKDLVDKLKKHPLARAVRIDKTRLAGLAATLLSYLRGEAVSEIPVWQMISAGLDRLEERAAEWAEALGESASVVEGESMVGGGSLPGSTLPTRLVAAGRPTGRPDQDFARRLAESLRRQDPPVIGRLSGNQLYLDPRSVLPEEDAVVLESLRQAVHHMLQTRKSLHIRTKEG
ncbi:MAG: L-seryl-tRNA(Sec) selenium transferase [Dehalococcoidia bacterium]|nr:L-seryl-tRNA(Sec) selenium transferase [Dehalococcoidia bacterium]